MALVLKPWVLTTEKLSFILKLNTTAIITIFKRLIFMLNISKYAKHSAKTLSFRLLIKAKISFKAHELFLNKTATNSWLVI